MFFLTSYHKVKEITYLHSFIQRNAYYIYLFRTSLFDPRLKLISNFNNDFQSVTVFLCIFYVIRYLDDVDNDQIDGTIDIEGQDSLFNDILDEFLQVTYVIYFLWTIFHLVLFKH